MWFNFENNIKRLSDTKSLISYQEIEEIAENSSLFEKEEIRLAIRFLSDLGTLEYFETSGLKDRVVINPQWIGEL